MNTKSIVMWVVIVLVVLIGGFFAYKMFMAQPASANNQQAAAGSTDIPADQVQAQEAKVGTGLEAKPGDTVSVLYEGRFTDGTVFDSSAMHNNEPLTFVLGAEGMIAGFQIGVNGMKEGGERLLAVPPALAYGSEDLKDASGKVVVPANSTLVFSVQLVKVTQATSTATQ